MENKTRGKRGHESDPGNSSDVGEPPSKQPTPCMFGKKCYRKNVVHLTEYAHPHLDNILTLMENIEDPKLPDDYKPEIEPSIILDQLCILQGINAEKKLDTKESVASNEPVPARKSQSSSSKGRSSGACDVAARLEAAAPYYFFLTKVASSLPTHSEPLSITFRELLDPSLGRLEASLQINFMVEMPWLMHHYYYHKLGEKPLLILYGADDDDLRNTSALPKNITAVRIRPPHPFGHHHTKMSLFHYHNGSLRVVVSTANLVASDWHNRTQGLWVSPLCPPLSPGANTSSGESPTEFKADLLRYLTFYKLPQLQEWLGRVRKADFSHIRVFFIASVPGTHQGPDMDRWGHRRLGNLLKRHVTGVDSSWPVMAQCSSIGSLGPDPEAWMCGELRASMAQSKGAGALQTQPAFKVIYPSKENVSSSLDGLRGGDCLPYSLRTHQKQTWFTSFLYEWNSCRRYRGGAVPHIKTYTRISPCRKRLAWFHLSSANLSKAAWGMNKKTKASGAGLFMMSYEAGVLFVPQLLVGGPSFNLESEEDGFPPFSMPYDLPLKRYTALDKPWVMEYLNALLKTKGYEHD